MPNTRKLLIHKNEHLDQFQLDPAAKESLRKIFLMICSDIFSFCEKHDLVCMLGGGSVLGAVRHGGFIPWDDDLDLNMPRKDYDRFAQLFSAEMEDKYEVFVPDGRHRITNLFMKVSVKGTLLEDIYTAGNPVKTGVAVDIFPIEDAPENKFLQKVKGIASDIFAYSSVSAYIFQNHNPQMRSLYVGSLPARLNYLFRCVLGAAMSFRNYSWWYCKFNQFVQGKPGSGFCTVPTGRKHYLGELRRKDVLYPAVPADFEGISVLLPHLSDLYLTQLYGDYKILPPEEQREQHFYTNIKFPDSDLF